MALIYKPLGNYIKLVDKRNKNLVTESVLGINIDKYFMPSVANTIGTDLSNYKLLEKGVFACNPMHVGRDGRLPVACYNDVIPAIVSPAYFMFVISKPEELDADYLMMCFRRPDFDRICSLKSDSSVRGGITWEDICSMEIPVPPISEQLKIVHDYKVVTDRIELLKKINRNLLEQCRTLYKELIADKGQNAKLEDLIVNVETGSRPKGGAQSEGVPSIGAEKIECFGVYDFSGEKYISEEYFEKLKKGHVLSGDVLLYKDGAYTGKSSMALDGFPHEKCAINEHVFKLNTKNNLHQVFLYFTLDNNQIKDYIYTLASSKAAQPGLNQTELLGVEIVMPENSDLDSFENQVTPILHSIAINAKENKILSELRDSLLPKLMSGELDVSVLGN